MASGGRSRAADGGGGEPAKRRKVGFSADASPVSCNANECLKLHIVRAGQELQGDGDEEYTCDPEFAEKIFGEDGKIYGYKGLKIDLWLHAASFHAYVQIQYTSKSAGGKKTPCTDVLAKLTEVFGDGLTEDRDSFQQSLLTYSTDFQQMIERHGNVVFSWGSEGNTSSSAKEGTSNGASSSDLLEKLNGEAASVDTDSKMADKGKATAEIDSEILDKENATADVDSEMTHKEIATADIDSEMPDKESAIADSISEMPDNERAIADSIVEPADKDDTVACGFVKLAEKLNEEIINGTIDSEVLDTLKEEIVNADTNTETPIKSTGELVDEHKEGNANGDKNTEIPITLTEQKANVDSSSEASDKLKRIIRVELSDPDVRIWHARLLPLSLLYIEGASSIESDDPLWEVYLAVEGEGPQMRLAGYCNVYRFYHYPDSTRLRISQILVLPPYQGDGFGLRLLVAVNTAAMTRGCYDVTMEEPSEVLQKVRDTMDVLRLLPLPSLDEAVKDAVGKLQAKKGLASRNDGSEGAGAQRGALVNFDGSAVVEAPSQSSQAGVKEKSLLAPPVPLVEAVRKSLKVSKMQFKRCWEQLLFMYLDPNDRDVQDVFQEAVVQRLNSEIFEKESGKKSVGKHVVDTDNEFDNSKTFIMMRSRKIDSAAGNGCAGGEDVPGDEVAALVPGPEEKGKVLQEELKLREDDMHAVARTAARHCRALGLNFPSITFWEQVAPGPSEPAAF